MIKLQVHVEVCIPGEEAMLSRLTNCYFFRFSKSFNFKDVNLIFSEIAEYSLVIFSESCSLDSLICFD